MRYFVVMFFVAASVWGQSAIVAKDAGLFKVSYSPDPKRSVVITPYNQRVRGATQTTALIVRDATGNVRIWAGMLDGEPVIAMLTEDGTPTFFQTISFTPEWIPPGHKDRIYPNYVPMLSEDEYVYAYERRAIQLMRHLGKWPTPTPTPRASDLVRSSTPYQDAMGNWWAINKDGHWARTEWRLATREDLTKYGGNLLPGLVYKDVLERWRVKLDDATTVQLPAPIPTPTPPFDEIVEIIRAALSRERPLPTVIHIYGMTITIER